MHKYMRKGTFANYCVIKMFTIFLRKQKEIMSETTGSKIRDKAYYKEYQRNLRVKFGSPLNNLVLHRMENEIYLVFQILEVLTSVVVKEVRYKGLRRKYETFSLSTR